MKVWVHRNSGPPIGAVVNARESLGGGATATIYRIDYAGETWAAKIFNKGREINAEKVLAMMANVPVNVVVELNRQRYPQFAWPCALIKDRNHRDIGFSMPLIDPQNSFTLDHFYDRGLFKKLRSPAEAAPSYKLEVAANLSALISELHKLQHYFIDFKPQNIRIFRRIHVVTLLDCDGFSIFDGSRRYPADLMSTDYIAPEAQRSNASPGSLAEAQDRYALAVILFQLLNRGTHPFQGIVVGSSSSLNTNDEKAAAGLYPHGANPDPRIRPRPQSTHHLWDDGTRALFDRAFKAASPLSRPTAHEWSEHFKKLLDSKALVRCHREANNLEHMRFRDKDCPACYLTDLQFPARARKVSSPPASHKPPSQAKVGSATGTYNPIPKIVHLQPVSGPISTQWKIAFAVTCVFLAILAFSPTRQPTSSGDMRRDPTTASSPASSKQAEQLQKQEKEAEAAREAQKQLDEAEMARQAQARQEEAEAARIAQKEIEEAAAARLERMRQAEIDARIAMRLREEGEAAQRAQKQREDANAEAERLLRKRQVDAESAKKRAIDAERSYLEEKDRELEAKIRAAGR